MKKIIIITILVCLGGTSYSQNSPFFIWGDGLDGSIFQKSGIYSDIVEGLLFEAPRSPENTRLPITFGWRGGHLALRINSEGNVGIGTTNPTAKLTVAGDIRAREIKVEANAGADFVFAEDYRLRSLPEVEQFITENKHLPDIAPANEMIEKGIDMGEMQIKLLQKIEELTLYVINLKKENEAQQKEIEILKTKVNN